MRLTAFVYGHDQRPFHLVKRSLPSFEKGRVVIPLARFFFVYNLMDSIIQRQKCQEHCFRRAMTLDVVMALNPKAHHQYIVQRGVPTLYTKTTNILETPRTPEASFKRFFFQNKFKM